MNEIDHWFGYAGCFSRGEAPGAIKNGSRVFSKMNHQIGTVLGSIDAMSIDKELCERKAVRFGYWIEWDDTPKVAFFVSDRRIKWRRSDVVAVVEEQV